MALISIGKVMTIQELERVFNAEWVLLEDPISNDLLEVQSGKLIYHTKDRNDLDRTLLEIRPRKSAVLYIGPWPVHLVTAL